MNQGYALRTRTRLWANQRIPPSLTRRYCLHNHHPRRTPVIAMISDHRMTAENLCCTTSSVCRGLVAPVHPTNRMSTASSEK